jgi:imidazole glycerol-phosphate synthase subunit HisH
MSTVTVVDYGMCNLLNVVRALEKCGAAVTVVEHPESVRDADRLVVPGVGAFPDCMRELARRGFDSAIRNFVAKERPVLGICVGLQALFDSSDEFGGSAGLGLIPGVVRIIPDKTTSGQNQRVPHIGWTHLDLPTTLSSWDDSILRGLGDRPAMYFVHSFTACPSHNENRLADAWYGGQQICAAARKGSLVGVQFHPEKSGEIGLKVLANFLAS